MRAPVSVAPGLQGLCENWQIFVGRGFSRNISPAESMRLLTADAFVLEFSHRLSSPAVVAVERFRLRLSCFPPVVGAPAFRPVNEAHNKPGFSPGDDASECHARPLPPTLLVNPPHL
jgi:hypothetical protein